MGGSSIKVGGGVAKMSPPWKGVAPGRATPTPAPITPRPVRVFPALFFFFNG